MPLCPKPPPSAQIDGFMNQYGCPFSRDPNSSRAGARHPIPSPTQPNPSYPSQSHTILRHLILSVPSYLSHPICPILSTPPRPIAGTGGPAPGTSFTNLATGATIYRKGGEKGCIPDELTARISNEPGTLSMANAGPNSGGSQVRRHLAHYQQAISRQQEISRPQAINA